MYRYKNFNFKKKLYVLILKQKNHKKYGIIIYKDGFVKKVALDLDGVVFDSENLYRVYT